MWPKEGPECGRSRDHSRYSAAPGYTADEERLQRRVFPRGSEYKKIAYEQKGRYQQGNEENEHEYL